MIKRNERCLINNKMIIDNILKIFFKNTYINIKKIFSGCYAKNENHKFVLYVVKNQIILTETKSDTHKSLPPQYDTNEKIIKYIIKQTKNHF